MSDDRWQDAKKYVSCKCKRVTFTMGDVMGGNVFCLFSGDWKKIECFYNKVGAVLDNLAETFDLSDDGVVVRGNGDRCCVGIIRLYDDGMLGFKVMSGILWSEGTRVNLQRSPESDDDLRKGFGVYMRREVDSVSNDFYFWTD